MPDVTRLRDRCAIAGIGLVLCSPIAFADPDPTRVPLEHAAETVGENAAEHPGNKGLANASRHIVENIRQRFPQRCVRLLSNGVDTSFFRPELRSEGLRRSLGVAGGHSMSAFASSRKACAATTKPSSIFGGRRLLQGRVACTREWIEPAQTGKPYEVAV